MFYRVKEDHTHSASADLFLGLKPSAEKRKLNSLISRQNERSIVLIIFEMD